jgi:hypothetical protein
MPNQPTMTNAQRALQLWSLLALAAMTRTVLTYEEVSNLTGLANQCGNVLGYLYHYCAQHNLPLLSVLVVDKHKGKPKWGLSDLDILAEQRRCFKHDWLEQPVPSLKNLEDAEKQAHLADFRAGP